MITTGRQSRLDRLLEKEVEPNGNDIFYYFKPSKDISNYLSKFRKIPTPIFRPEYMSLYVDKDLAEDRLRRDRSGSGDMLDAASMGITWTIASDSWNSLKSMGYDPKNIVYDTLEPELSTLEQIAKIPNKKIAGSNWSQRDLYKIAYKIGSQLFDPSSSGKGSSGLVLLVDNIGKVKQRKRVEFDVFDYLFNPSTGKGYDVSGTIFYSGKIDPKYLAKDGNLYMAGADGISIYSMGSLTEDGYPVRSQIGQTVDRSNRLNRVFGEQREPTCDWWLTTGKKKERKVKPDGTVVPATLVLSDLNQ